MSIHRYNCHLSSLPNFCLLLVLGIKQGQWSTSCIAFHWYNVNVQNDEAGSRTSLVLNGVDSPYHVLETQVLVVVLVLVLMTKVLVNITALSDLENST